MESNSADESSDSDSKTPTVEDILDSGKKWQALSDMEVGISVHTTGLDVINP